MLTRKLTVGKQINNKGFTLIELIVVVCLISIMLFFVVPKFSNIFNNSKKKINSLILSTVQILKINSVKNKTTYILNVDLNNNKLWVSDETMLQDALKKAKKNGFALPNDVKLTSVDFPGKDNITNGNAKIYFYKKGYSDLAIINFVDQDDNKWFVKIEPFLSNAKIYDSNE